MSGLRQAVMALMVALSSSVQAADQVQIATAVEKGLARLQTGASNYPKNRDCFSCHHQTMPIVAMTLARERGYQIDEAVLNEQIAFTRKALESKIESFKKGQGLGGGSTTAAYALLTLSRADQSSDELSEALVRFLLAKQHHGHWVATTKRPPSEGSMFTATALAVAGIRRYGADVKPTDATETFDATASVEQARQWMLERFPADTEDRVFRLWGLHAADAPGHAILAARDELISTQREDGGFAQTDSLKSDAYATGQSLTVLRLTGLAADSPVYQRGVEFLLKTQEADGAWIVKTRSRPVQVFFDNGDPGGPNQFISMSATGWATAALALEREAKP